MRKALILDLDNTIYPAASIAEDVFKELYPLIREKTALSDKEFEEVKAEMNRRPFSLVAKQFGLHDDLIQSGQDILRNTEAKGPARPFNHYQHVRNIPLTKFLVTKGFTRLQQSKINALGIQNDFEEIHIVDADKSDHTKKDVFKDIMERYRYTAEDVLVVGDDPESEISAAKELGIDTFLLDPENQHPDEHVTFRAAELTAVADAIK